MLSVLMNHHWTNINGMFTGFPVLEKHVLIGCWCRIEIAQIKSWIDTKHTSASWIIASTEALNIIKLLL